LRLHAVEIKPDVDVSLDRDQLFAQFDDIAVIEQRFPICLFFDLVCVLKRVLERAEALDDLDGALVADPGRAGHVIDRIATERHHVDHLPRWHAKDLLDLRRVTDQVVFLRIEDADAVADKLVHVLVRGDDEHLVSGDSGFVRERADHIVSLVVLLLDHRDAIRRERALDVGHLLPQVRRHLRAIGLVTVVVDLFELLRLDIELADAGQLPRFLVTETRPGLHDRRQVLRLEFFPQLVQHVHKHVGRSRGNAVACGHRSLADHRVIGTEDEAVSIDEENAGWLRSYLRRGRGLLLWRQISVYRVISPSGDRAIENTMARWRDHPMARFIR